MISTEIESNVIERDLWIEPGTKVGGFSAANEAIGTLVLRFDTKEHMDKVMENIDDYVSVTIA